MSERPIIFSGAMVRAILAGRKTMTRRILKLPPQVSPRGEWEISTLGGPGVYTDKGAPFAERACIWHTGTGAIVLPRWEVGDRLWVRENLRTVSEGLEYAADDELLPQSARGADLWNRYAHEDGPDLHTTLVLAIHMPRWASRITLEVTAVKIERLQDISEDDARAEGVGPAPGDWHSGAEGQAGITPRAAFALLWNTLHGESAWDANPEIVAITFRRVAA